MRKQLANVFMTMMFVAGVAAMGTLQAEAAEPAEILINEENFAKAKSDYAASMYKIATKADKNEDGKLSQDEIAEVTNIRVQVLPEGDDLDSDVLGDAKPPVFTKDDFKFDFKGIQYFTELEEVAVYQGFGDGLSDNEGNGGYDSVILNFDYLYQLKKLEKLSLGEADIKSVDFSKFESLKKVSFSDLYNLKKITVQKGSKLTSLWLEDCDKLQKVEVEKGNKKLKSLTLYRLKKYKAFDVDCKSLKKLYLDDLPKIKSVKVKSSPNLEEILVQNVPKLESLDVSALKKLDTLNLVNLKKVKKVTFSKKQRLTDIYFENLPKVTKLDCSLKKCTMLRLYKTGIQKLNFEGAKELKYLHLINNKIKKVDLSDSKKISSIRFASKHLKKLTLAKGNKLEDLEWTDAGLKKFAVKNFNYESIWSLDLKRNKIKKLNISKCKNLQYLYVDKDVEVIR